MEFIEEWFLVYWKQPDHWIVLLTYVDFWLSTKVEIFGFWDGLWDLRHFI